MLEAILGSFAMMFWSIVLLAGILYMFGLFFVQGVENYLYDHGEADAGSIELLIHFETIQGAAFSLFSAQFGNDWIDTYHALDYMGAFYQGAFVFYILFFEFTTMNILTGIFVDHALKLSAPDNEEKLMNKWQEDQAFAEDLKDILYELDDTRSGNVSEEVFNKVLGEKATADRCAVIGLDIKNACEYYKVLADKTGQDRLSIDTLVEACCRMKGPAQSVDVQTVNFQVDTMQGDVNRLLEQQDAIFKRLCEVSKRMPQSEFM